MRRLPPLTGGGSAHTITKIMTKPVKVHPPPPRGHGTARARRTKPGETGDSEQRIIRGSSGTGVRAAVAGRKSDTMSSHDHIITRSPTLTQSVAERICDAILDGRFEPGERLVETRLSGLFGVSRAPVREALKILETTGLVRIVVGRGTFVVSLSPDALARVVVAHALLMGLIGRLASVHGTARGLTVLTRAQRQVQRSAESGRADDARRHEEDFLRALFDTAEDTVLRQTVMGMRGQILVHRSTVAGDAVLAAHLAAPAAACLEALTAGDPDAVETTVRAATLRAGFAIIGQEVPPSVDAYLVDPPLVAVAPAARPAAVPA